MLGLTDTVQIGRFSAPVWLLSAIAGILGAYVCSRIVFRHDRDRGKKVMDVILTSLIFFAVVWKLSPVVTRLDRVIRQPLTILYLPGGPVGVVAGLIASFAYLLTTYLRRRPVKKIVLRGTALIAVVATVAFLSTTIAISAPRSLRFLPRGASGRSEKETMAPDFELGGIDGITHELSTYRGRYVVLNFWASWCPPCKAEIPELVDFYEEGVDNEPIILAVNQTVSEGSVDSIRSFAEEWEMDFPVLLDRRNDVHLLYGVRGIPTTFIIDPAGKVVRRRTGAVTAAWLRSVTGKG